MQPTAPFYLYSPFERWQANIAAILLPAHSPLFCRCNRYWANQGPTCTLRLAPGHVPSSLCEVVHASTLPITDRLQVITTHHFAKHTDNSAPEWSSAKPLNKSSLWNSSTSYRLAKHPSSCTGDLNTNKESYV